MTLETFKLSIPAMKIAEISKLVDFPDFSGGSVEVAQSLLGWNLLVDGIGGTIVETEAYDQDDPASHSFGGIRPRNAAMFGPAGCAYVYRSYGIHWCLNAVCREPGHGAGVLIRALEPLFGLETMRQRRGLSADCNPRLLCSGPGRIGQALNVDARLNSLPLNQLPFSWQRGLDSNMVQPISILAGPRIGISKAVERCWRFGIAGSRFLSRPF